MPKGGGFCLARRRCGCDLVSHVLPLWKSCFYDRCWGLWRSSHHRGSFGDDPSWRPFCPLSLRGRLRPPLRFETDVARGRGRQSVANASGGRPRQTNGAPLLLFDTGRRRTAFTQEERGPHSSREKLPQHSTLHFVALCLFLPFQDDFVDDGRSVSAIQSGLQSRLPSFPLSLLFCLPRRKGEECVICIQQCTALAVVVVIAAATDQLTD